MQVRERGARVHTEPSPSPLRAALRPIKPPCTEVEAMRQPARHATLSLLLMKWHFYTQVFFIDAKWYTSRGRKMLFVNISRHCVM